MTTPSRVRTASVLRVARPSTVDLIVDELRNSIFIGALAVGSPIGEVDMAAQLGVSRSPLREATQRLLQEGLLTRTPGRGLRVSRIDAEHVPDLYRARAAVESEAVRVIAASADPATIASLEHAFAILVKATEGDDAREIGDADLAFHQSLVEAAGSRRLTGYMSTLVMETRIATFSLPEGYAVRRSISPTYRVLLDSLAAGDAASAEAALRTQLTQAVERLTGKAEEVDTVEEAPDHTPPTVEPISAADIAAP